MGNVKGMGLKDLFWIEAPNQAPQAVLVDLESLVCNNERLRTGVLDTLATFQQANVPMVLLTQKSADWARELSHTLDLQDFFVDVLSSEDFSAEPSKRLEHALLSCSIDGNACVWGVSSHAGDLEAFAEAKDRLGRMVFSVFIGALSDLETCAQDVPIWNARGTDGFLREVRAHFPTQANASHFYLSAPTVVPRCVLFDWDGTIVESAQSCYKASTSLYKELGLSLPSIQQYMQSPHRSIRSELRDLRTQPWCGWTATDEEIDVYSGRFEDLLRLYTPKPLDLRPGARELIELLHNAKIPMGIVSNKGHDVLLEEVERLGMSKFFHTILGSGASSADKPSPAPLLNAVERMGAHNHVPIWFVGDACVDMEATHAANALGTHGCFFPVFIGNALSIAELTWGTPLWNAQAVSGLLDHTRFLL